MTQIDHDSVNVLSHFQARVFDHFFSEKMFSQLRRDLQTLHRYSADRVDLAKELSDTYETLEEVTLKMNHYRPLAGGLTAIRDGESGYLTARIRNLVTSELGLGFLRMTERIEPETHFTRREVREKLKSKHPINSSVRVGLTNFTVEEEMSDGIYQQEFTIPLAASFEPSADGLVPVFYDSSLKFPETSGGLEKMLANISKSRFNPGRRILQEALTELATEQSLPGVIKPISKIDTTTPINLVYLTPHFPGELPGYNHAIGAGFRRFDETFAVSLGLLGERFENPEKWREHFRVIDRLTQRAA